MKVLILNGNPSASDGHFDTYLKELTAQLSRNGEAALINLRDKTIKYCVGCYSCWLKTPGVCIHRDDIPELLRSYLASDIVVFASPLIMGFVSARVKAVQERILPVSLPYLCMKDDRMQHVPRYDKTPAVGLLLGRADPVQRALTENIFRNSKTRRVVFTLTMDSTVNEVAHAINGI